MLTVSGIAWGTVAVVLLMALAGGLKTRTVEQQHGIGDGIVIVWPTRTSRPYQGLGKGRPVRLEADEVLALAKAIPELEAISPEYYGTVRVQYGSKARVITLAGVYPAYQALRHTFPQPSGRFVDDLDISARRRVVFLGDEVKKELFGEQAAVGKTMLLNGVPFDVIGVLRPKLQSSTYLGRDEDVLFIPATTHASLFGRRFINDFVYRTANPGDHDIVDARINEILGRTHRFDPQDAEALYRWDTSESNRFFFYFFLAFDLLMGVSGVFTLLVGGIGVANIMYIVVQERTKEIGIKMAVGAKPRHILGHYLSQALVLTAAGGVLGFAISSGIVAIVGRTSVTEYIGVPQLSVPVVLATVLLIGGVGTVAGFFPARHAASMDPVQALGY
jgi:putative ABC transport system permease protein